MVAQLATGGPISHRACGALWELSGFRRGEPEVILPLHAGHNPAFIVHRSKLGPRDVVRRGPFLVTTVARTLIDVSSVLTPKALAIALDDALRKRLTGRAQIEERMAAFRRRAGLPLLRELLAARAPGEPVPQTEMETLMFEVARAGGLPRPVVQHRICDENGREIAVVDFAYPEARIGIETDGFRFHSEHTDWERGNHRGNDLELLRWRMYHFSWWDLTERPGCVIETLATALADEQEPRVGRRSEHR